MKSNKSQLKKAQMSFYNNRFSVSSRAFNKLINLIMLFYDKRLLQLIIEKAMTSDVIRVLDVGAGQGTDAVLLSENYDDVVAIDISKGALKTANLLSKSSKMQTRPSFVLSDAENLPFKEGVFDMVYCKDALHHVSNPVLSVKEMKRVARDKSSILAVEANPLNPQMIVIGLLYYSVDKGVFKNTSTRLTNIFSEAGLYNIRVTGTELLPRHILFEYRSPINRFIKSHNSIMLRFIASIETKLKKLTFLSKFSNYLVISGFKNETP